MTRPSPIELRDRMAKGYLDSYRRAGLDVTPEQMTKLAAADCELVDAADRAGELRGGPRSDAPPEQPRARPNVIAQAEQETGARLGAKSDPARTRAMNGNPQKVSERWGAAVARIKRILGGVGKSSSLVVAVKDAELGALAKEYAEHFAQYQMRGTKPPAQGKDRNPYRHMSERDASRKFMRAVEDICDRSTGKLGSWYVK